MKEKRIQIKGQDTQYLIRDDGTVWSAIANKAVKFLSFNLIKNIIS